MNKRVHTILCWILALSLIWLPLSVLADSPLRSPEKNNCHEMDSTMPGHKMEPFMIEHVAVNDSTLHKSMMLKKCCTHCDGGCTCNKLSSCSHNSNHTSPFIAITQYFSQSLLIAQTLIEYSIQYHNQIITPDFRPPIV